MSSFASYYKCALQVNPSSYAHFRGNPTSEETSYNAEVLRKCRENNIEVVGLANHGNVDSSESLRELLTNNGIVVFPGFEIMAAEKIHMVCLFPEDRTVSQLNRYLGAMGLDTAERGNETSSLTCLQIAQKVLDEGGFWYAAHITSDNGILKIGKLNTVWQSDLLIAAQIPDSKENIDPNYKNIVNNTDPQYKRSKVPAYINACDIAKPEDLDKETATTLIKMSEPSFQNFVMAFKDPDSRIRLNSEVETGYQSAIRSLKIFGGYLDGLVIEFSDNLVTIIGGRGTGKSTIINFIRYALDMPPKEKQRKKDFDEMIEHNLGAMSRIELIVESNAQFGRVYRIIKRYNADPVIEDADGNVSSLRIEDIVPRIEITVFYDPVSRRETSDSGFMNLMSSGAGKFARKYNDLLRQSNLVDFDDLICQVHQLMRDKECREYWQRRYKYIIIDEMQDTSELEYDTIKQMVGNNNIMMCGDYFQTIYEWRGSKPDNVLNSFIKEFNAERYMFAQNYRSTRTLTMATFGYLKNTYPDLVGKFCPPEIITKAPEAGEKILNVRVNRVEDEAAWVFNYLEQNPPKDPTRVCIMARSNPYISNIYKEFVRLNNARRSNLRFFTVDNDSKFFRKAVIKDIMAFINVLLNRTDLVNMARISKKYVSGIGQATIETINQSGKLGVALTSFLDKGLYESGDPYEPLITAFNASNVVIYDTETTGLDLSKDQIIQISAIKLDQAGNIIATLDKMVIPTIEISKGAQATHHQTIESIIANGGTELKLAMEEFSEFVKGSVLVGHNSLRFDSPLVKRQLRDCGLPQLEIIAEYDTMIIAKQFLPKMKNYKLDTLCNHYHFVNENAHNALGDITATGKVLTALLQEGIIPTAMQRKQLLKKYATKFEPLYRFIGELASMLDRNQVSDLVEKIIREYDLNAIYSEPNDVIAMDDLRHAISASKFDNGEAYLREFVNDAALSGSQMDLLIQKLHKIPIITVHQSKGCEFDLVILVGADDDNFPTYLAKKNGTEGEEKRVFYVAITRAKKKLIMTSISTKVNRGGTWPVSPSRYIANIPGQYIDTIRG